MLNKKQTKKSKLIAYLMLLPLAFIFSVANNAGAIAEINPFNHEIQNDKFNLSGVIKNEKNTGLPGVNIISKVLQEVPQLI